MTDRSQSVVDEIRSYYAANDGVSPWWTVRQEDLNKFGESTGDSDWLHTDPDRAARESPFGGTIAFGFWTISLLTQFMRATYGRDYPEGALYGLNYGFDRLRLLTPVRTGSRIRNRTRLLNIEPRGDGRYLVKSENTIQIENEAKPALVCEWLFLLAYPV